MKTLIYVLSTGKTGTTRLAYALSSIGIDAHHEIVDIKPLYLKWMKKRFTQNPTMSIESAKPLLSNELLKYLQGEGYFADISHYLSTLYPVIDGMDIKTRSVHLTRNFFPHRVRVYGVFLNADQRITDNTEHLHRDIYYPAELSWCSDIGWEEWVAMSQFERICRYWVAINEYFLTDKRKIFHVEDFNVKVIELLETLYPEATEEQKETFKKALFHEPTTPENSIYPYYPYTLKMSENEKEIYSKVCKPTLKKLGYDITNY